MNIAAGVRAVLLSVVWAGTVCVPAGCMDQGPSPYKEMAAAEVKTRFEAGEPLVFLAFETGEECGYEEVSPVVALPFPLQTAEHRQSLQELMARVRAGRQLVIILCPRHREEAKRVHDFLTREGMDPERLYILLEGRENWPYT